MFFAPIFENVQAIFCGFVISICRDVAKGVIISFWSATIPEKIVLWFILNSGILILAGIISLQEENEDADVMLFQKDRICLDNGIWDRTLSGEEVQVCMGERIGRVK